MNIPRSVDCQTAYRGVCSKFGKAFRGMMNEGPMGASQHCAMFLTKAL